MAGLDGIQNKIEPPAAGRQGPLRAAAGRARRTCRRCPASLDEVLDALEADHEYLLEGGVFTADLIETWIDYKRDNEIDADPAAPAPARVRALLRHLARTRDPAALLPLIGDRREAGPGRSCGAASPHPVTAERTRSIMSLLTLAHLLGPDAHEAALLGRVGCCLCRLDDPAGERGSLLRIGLGPHELLHLAQLVEHLLARRLPAPGL